MLAYDCRTDFLRRRLLAAYVLPAFGQKRVDQINRDDVLAVLVPVMTATPEAGRKARQYVRGVLAWAQAAGHVSANAANGEIDETYGGLPVGRHLSRPSRADGVKAEPLHHRRIGCRDGSALPRPTA